MCVQTSLASVPSRIESVATLFPPSCISQETPLPPVVADWTAAPFERPVKDEQELLLSHSNSPPDASANNAEPADASAISATADVTDAEPDASELTLLLNSNNS